MKKRKTILGFISIMARRPVVGFTILLAIKSIPHYNTFVKEAGGDTI